METWLGRATALATITRGAAALCVGRVSSSGPPLGQAEAGVARARARRRLCALARLRAECAGQLAPLPEPGARPRHSCRTTAASGSTVPSTRDTSTRTRPPGLSFVELPLAEALRLPPANKFPQIVVEDLGDPAAHERGRLPRARVRDRASSARVSRPGSARSSLVTFALGTLIAPFAAMNFDQVPAAALGFGAFLARLAAKAARWPGSSPGSASSSNTKLERSSSSSGSTSLLATRSGRHDRCVRRRSLPGLVVPSPPTTGPPSARRGGSRTVTWTTSTSPPSRAGYSGYASQFVRERSGLRRPRRADRRDARPRQPPRGVSRSSGGNAPRRGRVCVAVIAIFLLLNSGYFLPYGGSPGPRFLLPALPFLALGLGPAFARAPRLTAALASVSIASMTIDLPRLGRADADERRHLRRARTHPVPMGEVALLPVPRVHGLRLGRPGPCLGCLGDSDPGRRRVRRRLSDDPAAAHQSRTRAAGLRATWRPLSPRRALASSSQPRRALSRASRTPGRLVI